MSKRQRWTTSLPCDCIFTLHQLHHHVMHWHGNIYPSVATWLTSEGPWVIWENTEACWRCQRCKVAGNNPGPINMFAVRQTVLSFVSELASNLRCTKGKIAFGSPQSTSRGFGDSSQNPRQPNSPNGDVDQVGPEYVQTSGEPFVYYHKAVL